MSAAEPPGRAPDDAAAMLGPEDVVPWLRRAGVTVPRDVRVTRLGGGVSNVVTLVESADGRWIVKQSLGRLDVPGEWHAPRERILGEAAALAIMESAIPGRVPRVVAVDEGRLAIAMLAAPVEAQDWRHVLLSGAVEPAVGAAAGETLGRLHAATAGVVLPASLTDGDQLETLRLDPYFRESGRRLPDVAGDLDDVVDHLATTAACLVHGDYSPKNLLTWPAGLWVIDTEVAHRGEPVFDVAFLTHHLVMKALVMPEHGPGLQACWQGFLRGYEDNADPADPALLDRLAGALLLARVVGKSPAAYLGPAQADRAVALGRALLGGRRTLPEAWRSLADGGIAA